MKKKILMLISATFMALSLTACGEQTTPNTNNNTNNNVTKEIQSDSSTQETPTPDTPKITSEGDLGDYHVSIGDCTFTKDIDENKVIVINYSFTNNSDDTVAPLWALSTKAFQDGVQLEIAFVLNADSYNAEIAQKELKPGASLEGCQVAYVLTSDSPVEFEVEELISFNDSMLAKTFDIK